MDVSIYTEGLPCALCFESCLPTSTRSCWHLAYPSFVKEFTRRCLLRYVENVKHLNHSASRGYIIVCSGLDPSLDGV